MTTTQPAGRGYLDRLQVAADIRLIDDDRKWPALAKRVAAVTEGLPRDALSPEEQLLHATARALGGEPEPRGAVRIAAAAELAEQDVPFAAVVLARNGIATPEAQAVYERALRGSLSPALDASLRLAFERGFRPELAALLAPLVKLGFTRHWPSSTWQRTVRALDGHGGDLVELALGTEPQFVTGTGQRVERLLVASGRWRELLASTASDVPGRDPEVVRSRLQLLVSTTAWRVPLPLAATTAIVERPDTAALPHAASLLALASGDLGRVRHGGDPMAAENDESMLARGIAMLGGSADDVHDLWTRVASAWSSSPPASDRPTTLAVLAALFAIELDDRSALRALAEVLAPRRDALWAKLLLARIYLVMLDHWLVRGVLGDESGPVVQLLEARARALIDRSAAIPALRGLVEANPGWSEARLRLGLALATVAPDEALAILEAPRADGPDSAALGAPSTAQAAALLAAGELHRRARRSDLAAQRIDAALSRAPGSPLVARQALRLAVALRSRELVTRCRDHLQRIAPGAVLDDRLFGGMLEVQGDTARALSHYRAIGAWDRVGVLEGANPGRWSNEIELGVTASVAALHASAVVASRAGDPMRAARALEKAAAQQPHRAAVLHDLVIAHHQWAAADIARGGLATLLDRERDLRAIEARLQDARVWHRRFLRVARVAVGIAICRRWIDVGDTRSARRWLAELLAETSDPAVRLHAAALAIREGRHDDARRFAAGTSEHAVLLAALVALRGDATGPLSPAALAARRAEIAGAIDALSGARVPAVAAAARMLAILTAPVEDQPYQLAAWCGVAVSDLVRTQPYDRAPAPGPTAIGLEATMFVAARLAAAAGTGAIAIADVAAYLEQAAAGFDGDGARRARLFALGLRALQPEPGPLAYEALDIARPSRSDERRYAAGLLAHEAQRRRRARDARGAARALADLVALVDSTPTTTVAALAPGSLGAQLALAAWRAAPSDFAARQAAIAMLLRHAVSCETEGLAADVCTAAWTEFVAAAGGVFVSDRAWRELAARRASVYLVSAEELSKARDACQRRLDDVFGALIRWHDTRNDAASQARIASLRTLLAREVAVARSIDALASAHEANLGDAIPAPLGPCGFDLLGLRARAIEALSAIPPDSTLAARATEVRGILQDELADAWFALHEDRIEIAEQLASTLELATRSSLHGTRLRAAICLRRMEHTQLSRALDVAVRWVAQKDANNMPEELAIKIVEIARRVYERYGLGQARRALQKIRDHCDSPTLRRGEAGLLWEYLTHRTRGPEERIRVFVDILRLAPSDSALAELHREVAAALARASSVDEVDAIAALLRAEAGPAEVMIVAVADEARVRRIELMRRHIADPGHDVRERIRQRVEILVLAPGDAALAELRDDVAAALAETSSVAEVDEVTALLRGVHGAAQPLVDDVIAQTQSRRLELVNAAGLRASERIADLEARVAELTSLLDQVGDPRQRMSVRYQIATLHSALSTMHADLEHKVRSEQHRLIALKYRLLPRDDVE